MRREANSPADYVRQLEGEHLAMVKLIRPLIKKAAPRAKERVDRGMLFYGLDGDLFALAAQKHYVSLYVMAYDAFDEHKAALKEINCGKCCLRFRKKADVPVDTIRALLKTAVKYGVRKPSRGKA